MEFGVRVLNRSSIVCDRGDQDSMMECVTVQRTEISKETEKDDEKSGGDSQEYSMLVGECSDTKEARNEWIDAVERSLEFEAFENGEKHMERGLGRVRQDGDYPLKDVPRWMI